MDSLENKQGLAKNNTLKSNEKRLQSLKSLKKAYQNQKSIIQSALSSIDKASNKIIFDEEYTESTPNNSKSGTVNKGKTTLFEDESDEDNIEIDFSYKQQFEGEEGQKLLELQSRYKNDKRFHLNERFLNDPVQDDAHENGYGENEAEHDETSLVKEKKRELEILDEVLGKFTGKPNKKAKAESEKKLMVRFDPSQPQHSKYELKKEENKSKRSKKEKTQNAPEILKEKKIEETEVPEVSKEIFYQVKGNLKDSLHENKTVSLLSMFGQTIENGTEVAEQETQIKIAKSNLSNERNPFRYDSSDDDEEKEIDNKKEVQHIDSTQENEGIASVRNNAWVETFFFKDDDYRLQEGFDFLEKMKMEDKSEFSKSRRELKEIVRTKVRNVQQKKKPFKRKLGGNKRRKNIKMKKALKK